MNFNETEIALLAGGVIGLLCFLTGVAMIYEPAALLVLGIGIVAAVVVAAFLRGDRSAA